MSKGVFKQLHKASQYMSEKIGNENDKTTMDKEFLEMERKVDNTAKTVQDIMTYTKEYLQPNPASRAKLNMMNTYSKIQGKQKDMKYPQPEYTLGESMQKHGTELGPDSHFGMALVDVGESLIQLSEIKDSLDVNVKQNFLDPLQQLLEKDIKEVMHHRKKLSGRRLDYDYKRKKGSKVPPEELKQAEEKLQESLELADSSMFNLLSGDVEQVSQLAILVESELEYHRQSADILESLHENLTQRIEEINSGPCKERSRKTLQARCSAEPPPASPVKEEAQEQPCCEALFDFESYNDGEMNLKEGDRIILVSQVDENWFEGMRPDKKDKTGYFPISYVKVIVPLPEND